MRNKDVRCEKVQKPLSPNWLNLDWLYAFQGFLVDKYTIRVRIFLCVNQSVDSLQKQVSDLQKNLRKLQEKGLPLYPSQGATVELWERKLKQLEN